MKKLFGLVPIFLALLLPYKQEMLIYEVKSYSYQVFQNSLYYEESNIYVMGSVFEKELLEIITPIVSEDNSVSHFQILFAYFDENVRVNKDKATLVNICVRYEYLLQNKSISYCLSLKEN